MHDVAINPLCGKVIRFRSRSSVPRQPHLGVRIVLRAQHEVMAAMGAALRGGVIRPRRCLGCTRGTGNFRAPSRDLRAPRSFCL